MTTQLEQAARLALEALVKTDAEPGSKAWEREAEAITAIRAALHALKQPAQDEKDRQMDQLIQERDHRDEIIDKLCDAVLGPDRYEWSSQYFFEDAVREVEERMAALAQPAQDEPVAKVVSTAPERIWLDLGFDPEVEDEVSFDDLFEATWSHDNATGNGIEYVRADLTRPQAREPLTDEQRSWIVATCITPRQIIDLVEKMHGIKGEA